ncbi:hypothetical protein SA496_24265 [Pseudomonas sp. JS3066]|uniref:hypothetical protein n=1 Tax=unclassified Pseudomonas TaxID=196821 RepID=UPI002E7B0CD5|nr:hypothetical protein [Pseudomonas sp. JS3066]WVK92793.1 hypothetical protein SA496_24265 [Pseudomonas sp. JS3066]
MIKFRMAREYLAGPIFCPEPDCMGPIDVDDLPLSLELKAEITTWDSDYQATFNSDYPPDSGFGAPEMELRHIAEGQKLAKEIQKELGADYAVEYYP